MGIAEDIKKYAKSTFGSSWAERDGRVVPEPKDIALSNSAVRFERATCLYADLDGSTDLVSSKKWQFSGEIYKTFLYAASRLIRDAGGSIVSYDGDRVMGIFISGSQCNDAVSCALKINYAVKTLVQNELERGKWNNDYAIKHVVGLDTSEVRAARTGVRGDNDLVWIGNAPNLAAKLTGMSAENPIWITDRVYDYLKDSQKLGSKGESIWKRWTWKAHNNDTIYSTNYHRSFS